MKTIAFGSTTFAALLAVAAPAFAGNVYLLTVPINATGLKTGTQISVSCSAGNSFTDVKGGGGDANSRAAALDANPPKDAAKVTVTVGTGPADAVVPLVTGQAQKADGTSGNPTAYQCWSSYGGYVTGSLTAAGSTKVTPTDSWNTLKNTSS